MFTPSAKYHELIAQYAEMARDGYKRRSGSDVSGDKVYSDQEAVKFRTELKPLFARYGISSVLDYGGGGGDWREKQVPEGGSLAGHLGVSDYRVFEPARDRDDRGSADAAVCFDVMEHIYLADVGYVLNDLFAQAGKLVVINVACYPAAALLPNGENAHITVRPPQWWKGAVDLVSAAWPDVAVTLYCSTGYNKASRFETKSFAELNMAPGYVR